MFRKNVANDMLLASMAAAAPAASVEEVSEKQFLSSVDEQTLLSAVSAKANQDDRSLAASIAVEWANDNGAELGDLYAMIYAAVAAGDDSDDEELDELTPEQDEHYETLLELVGDVLISVGGASAKSVQTMLDEDSEDAALDVAEKMRSAIKETSADELIADYAVKEELLMSAMKKVVRDGKVKFIKKRVRKVRLSAAQRAGLKKARLRSNTAAAKAKRRKSNRIRTNSGL